MPGQVKIENTSALQKLDIKRANGFHAVLAAGECVTLDLADDVYDSKVFITLIAAQQGPAPKQ
jgi:hypothetical protein